jgi:hypothetical protein
VKRAAPVILLLLLTAGVGEGREDAEALRLRVEVGKALREIDLMPGDLRVRDQRLWKRNVARFRESGHWAPGFEPPAERDPLRPRLIDRSLRHPLTMIDLGVKLARGGVPDDFLALIGEGPPGPVQDWIPHIRSELGSLDGVVRDLLPRTAHDRRLATWMLDHIGPSDLKAARKAFGRFENLRFRMLARKAAVLVRTFRRPPKPWKQGWPEDEPERYDTEFGPLLIGTEGDDLYTEDAWIILEPGGDDVYLNNAGGARGEMRTALVVDLAGNDRYLARERFSQGAGHLGVGILIDLGGDDLYSAGEFAQGAALGGVGILHDEGGNDVFTADRFAQGAAAFGVGILTDAGDGPDRYAVEQFGQGFARTAGYGILEDRGGHDRYIAGTKYPSDYYAQWTNGRMVHWSFVQGCGFGFFCRYDEPDGEGGRRLVTREMFPGGVGLLLDRTGDDIYTGSMYAQGTGYFYGLGILADLKGNDRYTATWYGQGAAPHYAAGLLVDAEGNDVYHGMHQVQGNGRDFASAVFLDLAGNDRYFAEDRVQGCGDHSDGFGIFIDAKGNDVYEALRASGRGFATGKKPRWPYHDVGVFLDLEGRDRYRGPAPGKNGTVWRQEETWRGVGVDR